MDRLTPISPGVVHSSPNRTRLKAARWQDASESDVALVKDALERVPGVTEVRPMLRGYVIEHESRPDVVENIGVALSEVSPVLLEDLIKDETKTKKKKSHGAKESNGDGWLDRFKFDLPHFNLSMPDVDLSTVTLSDAGPIAKKAIPAVLAGAGLLMLLEGEALLAGVGPLALFYWAFDYNWKMKQEKVLDEVAAVELHE
jgi:hypothetical protein